MQGEMNVSYKKMEIQKVCPLCNSKEISFWCEGYDQLYRLSDQTFKYFHCKECTLKFLYNRPLRDEIWKFYPLNYGPYQGNIYENKNGSIKNNVKGFSTLNSLFLKGLSKLNFVVDQNFIDKTLGVINKQYNSIAPGSIFLDFGCGSDAFLNNVRLKGIDTIGMDFSPQVVDKVRSSGHKAILYSSEDSWNDIDDDSLAFVRMNHVLEHLYNPLQVLKVIKNKMKSGSILHLAIPNPKGISATLYKGKWWGLDAPRHIMLFSSHSLKKLIINSGFSNFEILHENLTKDLARSIAFKKYDKGQITHEEAFNALNQDDLKTLLNIPCRLAQKFGKADRIHAFITKE
jgi:2-polyprenyl-3-methyl-5-hydroxy-6-metoxy-1,4-benzoquinol methylase